MEDKEELDKSWIPFRHMIRSPGEHALIIGSTGTGKTQLLYFILERLRTWSPKDSIVWFDSGKSSEILVLTQFAPVTIHIPEGHEVRVIPKDPALLEKIQVKTFYHPAELWDNLTPGRINIFCIEPFFPDPKKFSLTLTEIFRDLILRARQYRFHHKGMIPMTIFIDEIQWVVPAERTALNQQHNTGAKWFQRNIEYLRSMGIRIVGATQGWSKLRPGARDSFGWLLLKRGARFSLDRPHLAKYNERWQGLRDDEFILVEPDSIYSNVKFVTKFYGTGKKVGRVYYITAGQSLEEYDEE
jgi:hypothetical protein